MAYREASRRPKDLPGAAMPLPKAPLTKGAYWVSYVVLIILPLVLAGVLFECALMSAGPAESMQGMLFAAAGVCFVWSMVALVGLRAWGQVAGKKWSARNNVAVRLIGEGKPDEAIAILDEILAKCRIFPVAHSLYLWNRGIALMRLGRFIEARAAIASVQATNWLDRPRFNHFVPAVMVSMGNLEALEGNLDAAEQWRRSAHAKLTSSSSVAALPLDVLLAARRGEFDRAEALCEAQWTAAEAALTARDMKLLRVLRAYVANRRASADRREVDQWLAGAKPIPAGMFDYLGTAWPEFEVFASEDLRS
jgi:hypothetical protein